MDRGNHPRVEVRSDAHTPSRGIPSAHIQASDIVDVLVRFDAVQAHDPHGLKVQWLRQPLGNQIRKPPSYRVQEHDESLSGRVRSPALSMFFPYRMQN